MAIIGLALSTYLWIAQSAAFESPVRYTTPGASARTIVEALSKSSGIPLETSRQTADEVLAVRLEGQPLREAMARIAWAVHGDWKKDGERYRLVRDAALARAEEKIERSRIAERFRRAIDAHRQELAGYGEFTPAEADRIATQLATIVKNFTGDYESPAMQQNGKLERLGPAGRAMLRFATLLDPDELAALPVGEKIVFSTQPTPTQRAMGNAAQAIVREYVREQAIWSDAAQKRQITNPKVGDTTYIIGTLTSLTDRMDTPGKVLFTVFRPDKASPAYLQLKIADSKGIFIAQPTDMISQAGPAAPPANPKELEEKVSLPENEWSLMRLWSERPRKVPPTPEQIAYLSNPEKHDPLGFTAGAMLVAIANARKVPLVADLPDSLFPVFLPKNQFSPEPYLRNLARMRFERDDTKGWIALRPQMSVWERENRIDRRLLGEYLRRGAAQGILTVDERAAFAMKTPLNASETLPSQLLEAIGLRPIDNQTNPYVLRLYGAMSPAQIEACQKEGLPYPSLTPYQREMLRRYLAADNVSLQFQPIQTAPGFDHSVFQRFYNGLLGEPTESLPNGPTSNTVVKLNVSGETVLSGKPKEGKSPFMMRALTAQEVAWSLFVRERRELFPEVVDELDYVDTDRFTLGRRLNYAFTFQFASDFSAAESLQVTKLGTTGTISLSRLPQELDGKVREHLEGYRRSYANAKPENRGGTNPPPP